MDAFINFNKILACLDAKIEKELRQYKKAWDNRSTELKQRQQKTWQRKQR